MDKTASPCTLEQYRTYFWANGTRRRPLKMLIQANPEAANDPQLRKTMAYVSKKLEEKLKEVTKN